MAGCAREGIADDVPGARRIRARAERIVNLVAGRVRQEQPRKVAGAIVRRGEGPVVIDRIRRDHAADSGEAHEEEQLFAAVVNLGNQHRAAERAVVMVVAAGELFFAVAQTVGQQFVAGCGGCGDVLVVRVKNGVAFQRVCSWILLALPW